MNQRFSGPVCGCFKDVRSKEAIGKNCSLLAIFAAIKVGRWRVPTEAIRAVSLEGLDIKSQEAKEKALKRNLPGFMMSATTLNGRHKKEDCGPHTEVVQIDVDGIGNAAAVALRDRLANDRHILAAWISPRGNGVKIAVRVQATLETHERAWRQAAAYVQANYEVTLDPSPKAHNAICFVSFDPDMVLKAWEDVMPLPCEEGGEIVHSNSGNSETQETHGTQKPSDSVPQKPRGNGVVVCVECSGFDVSPFVPTARGQSNRLVFSMARHLKTYERKAGGESSYDERIAIFDRWWQASEANVDPSLGYFGFLTKWQLAYDSAKFAADESPLEFAWQLVLSEALPAGTLPPGLISDRAQEKDKLRHLAALCYHLQSLQGEKPFFLGCREAGKLIGAPFSTANVWLLGFALPSNPNRILELIRRGSKAAELVNEWRFIRRSTTGGNT